MCKNIFQPSRPVTSTSVSRVFTRRKFPAGCCISLCRETATAALRAVTRATLIRAPIGGGRATPSGKAPPLELILMIDGGILRLAEEASHPTARRSGAGSTNPNKTYILRCALKCACETRRSQNPPCQPLDIRQARPTAGTTPPGAAQEERQIPGAAKSSRPNPPPAFCRPKGAPLPRRATDKPGPPRKRDTPTPRRVRPPLHTRWHLIRPLPRSNRQRGWGRQDRQGPAKHRNQNSHVRRHQQKEPAPARKDETNHRPPPQPAARGVDGEQARAVHRLEPREI